LQVSFIFLKFKLYCGAGSVIGVTVGGILVVGTAVVATGAVVAVAAPVVTPLLITTVSWVPNG
jgi:hypothetical protein